MPAKNLQVKIKYLSERAKTPTYATDGSGCFDIYYSGFEGYVMYSPKSIVLETDLAFEIPDGYVMLVFSRSGQGFEHNVRLANCTGIIDSDYRGELKVKLTRDNTSNADPFWVKPGDRIAQAMIIEIPKVKFLEVDELSDTIRGAGGLGSTNK